VLFALLLLVKREESEIMNCKSLWYVIIIILNQLLCISKFGQEKSWYVVAVQQFCDVRLLEIYQ